ncbi:putative peptidylprolyl isomerase [Helianthus annuus]|uniref:peptidyl-prolyl cis-trans isomerase FKBP43-like isoform X2 n=1 Tax=Helianthus annuus TaxID=4232 RepID=UPI000B901919|nr:peptidyl-prolyl cis-trans isomerase FKBP43-like isoform X2 [Helianthus annuus]KAJ0527182.1 putative peptidylprolyl isomerase [Helianthus annuus]KAJ0543584.1 putative peptidylprolyl isomerase [Helianthus annuus]KAJ0708638.1 putative peptidylprolyl isomerase [Helianthus annuus]
MAFWGVYLKPNEPYTLRYDYDAVPNRLRITQATLGDATRNSPARSIVRCSVGDKPAIAICSLSIKELTCCQLELEFEESHDVVFSVMGPRGVYLAGYLVASAPAAHQLSIDHKGKEETTMEIAGCSDHDLRKDELDSDKTGHIKESIDVQNTRIERSDKNIEGGKRLLKCSRDKNVDGNIITLKQKTGKDGNEGSSNEDQDKTIAVKTHSVFGRLLEKKRHATERRKMNQNRKRKRKQSSSEATASKYVDLWGSGAHEGNRENLRERKKKRKAKTVAGRKENLCL